MKKTNTFIKTIFYGGYIFLYMPLVLVILYSFNTASTAQWTGISFKWYTALWHNAGLLKATKTSLNIAFVSATLSVIVGTVSALISTHKRHTVLKTLIALPLVMPEMVIGLSIVIFFLELNQWGWNTNHFLMIVTAHTLLGGTYAKEMIQNQLLSIDKKISEAAMDLGASRLQTFALVIVPLLIPSLTSSWMMAFIISFDDVILASFTSGPGMTTLPLFIFSSIKMGYTPEMNALATCIASITVPLIALMSYAYQKSSTTLPPSE